MEDQRSDHEQQYGGCQNHHSLQSTDTCTLGFAVANIAVTGKPLERNRQGSDIAISGITYSNPTSPVNNPPKTPNKAIPGVGFFVWLEDTAVAEWVRFSIVGYPTMISAHAVGMGVMVGLALMLNLRLLGAFPNIPFSFLYRLLPLAWVGFIVNFVSGTMLFAAQATTFATQTTFILKIIFVAAGAASVGYLQPAVRALAEKATANPVPPAVRGAAVAGTVVWVSAIVLGRLTAYV